MIEEVFPGGVFVGAQAEVDDGVAFGFEGGFEQVHVCLVGGAAAFFGVAVDAGTHEVVPGGFAAKGAWDDVVEGEFLCGEFFAAVLAEGVIASVDVAAVELDVLAGQAIVDQEANDTRDGDFEADGADEIVVFSFVDGFELGELDPGDHVVRQITAIPGFFDGDDLGELALEEGKGSLGGDDTDGHVQAIENQYVAGETRNGYSVFHAS